MVRKSGFLFHSYVQKHTVHVCNWQQVFYFGKASDFNGPLTDFKASKCFRAKKVKMSGKRKHVVSQKES